MSQRRAKKRKPVASLRPEVPEGIEVKIHWSHVGTIASEEVTTLTYEQTLSADQKREGKHGVRIKIEIANNELPEDPGLRRKAFELAVGKTICHHVERRILNQ